MSPRLEPTASSAWAAPFVVLGVNALALFFLSTLAAHVLTRLVIATGQVGVLLLVALVLFNVTIVGGLFPLIVVALLGTILFLTIGFALAGWATTENQVPAIAQLITLPQFFFSGVFFSKNAAPELIRPVTNWLPLTLLNDALREISVQGATLHWFFASSATPLSGTVRPSSGTANVWDARSGSRTFRVLPSTLIVPPAVPRG